MSWGFCLRGFWLWGCVFVQPIKINKTPALFHHLREQLFQTLLFWIFYMRQLERRRNQFLQIYHFCPVVNVQLPVYCLFYRYSILIYRVTGIHFPIKFIIRNRQQPLIREGNSTSVIAIMWILSSAFISFSISVKSIAKVLLIEG